MRVPDITDENAQKIKLKYYHETKVTHRGINKNITAYKKHFYWPDMDVMQYVNTSETCQKSKYECHPNTILQTNSRGSNPLEL